MAGSASDKPNGPDLQGKSQCLKSVPESVAKLAAWQPRSSQWLVRGLHRRGNVRLGQAGKWQLSFACSQRNLRQTGKHGNPHKTLLPFSFQKPFAKQTLTWGLGVLGFLQLELHSLHSQDSLLIPSKLSLAKLGALWAPGSCQSLPPSPWDYRHRGSEDPNSDLQACSASALTVENSFYFSITMVNETTWLMLATHLH